MYETDTIKERVILVAVCDDRPDEDALDELSELVRTSGGDEIGRITQCRESVHPLYYLGKGKLLELKELIEQTGATGIVCDDELTGAQQKNMERMLDTKIMDRTMVILDIFARHAATAEGKVQVELAQLRYGLSHLAGIGAAMSRLGGGIGTRGPGEKKLETDRRHIRNRITDLGGELKEIEQRREVLREKRKKNAVPVVSLVGYTNAGKSTLMNALTGAGVLAEEKLFATLDTTTRKLALPGGTDALCTDTVGFIQKLPHGLVQAFRATLEELAYTDILLHVVDASNAAREKQMAVVYKTLKELKCESKPVITVFNKMDLEAERPLPKDRNALSTVQISALTGSGMEELLVRIEETVNSFRIKICVLIPYSDGQIVHMLHDGCEILAEEHREDGTFFELYANEEMQERLKKYRLAAR